MEPWPCHSSVHRCVGCLIIGLQSEDRILWIHQVTRREWHCCVGKMEGGTLTPRVSVQVKRKFITWIATRIFSNLCYFAYLSIIILQSVFLDSISVPENNLSTAAAIAITVVICLLVAFIAGTVCGALLTVCISRWNKKRCSSKPAPNTQEQQQAVTVYEEVDTLSKKIELKGNVAYGPVKLN